MAWDPVIWSDVNEIAAIPQTDGHRSPQVSQVPVPEWLAVRPACVCVWTYQIRADSNMLEVWSQTEVLMRLSAHWAAHHWRVAAWKEGDVWQKYRGSSNNIEMVLLLRSQTPTLDEMLSRQRNAFCSVYIYLLYRRFFFSPTHQSTASKFYHRHWSSKEELSSSLH